MQGLGLVLQGNGFDCIAEQWRGIESFVKQRPNYVMFGNAKALSCNDSLARA
jgi:hypothetical protein